MVVNTADQPVVWSRYRLGELDVLRMGSEEQPVLKKFGDNPAHRLGSLLPRPRRAPPAPGRSPGNAPPSAANSSAPASSPTRTTSPSCAPYAAARCRCWPGPSTSGPSPSPSRATSSSLTTTSSRSSTSTAGYAPNWRRKGADAADLLRWSERDYKSLTDRSRAFDDELLADLHKAGGDEYAQMCALSYRQANAAHKLAVDADGSLLFFSKENFSNGCINTIDVFYPSAPLYLLTNPKLLRGSVEPILQYAMMERWPWAYAPHDLGAYPLANGQVYGGGERSDDRQMPVEESGNMLLLVSALAKAEGNALARRQVLAAPHPVGRVPPRQRPGSGEPALHGRLCRTPGAQRQPLHQGHRRHRRLLHARRHARQEGTWRRSGAPIGEDYAKKWMKLAGDGDHTVLAFGSPRHLEPEVQPRLGPACSASTSSPADLARKEIAYYKTKQNTYGLPLDNRERYTKLDWVYWTATLAENDADFRALVAPTWKFANESASRVPLTDWYFTHDARQRGFQARSVVGGLFIKMLADPQMWKKWSSRAK